MEFKTLTELYDAKKQCNACNLRGGCTQVVAGVGSYDHPPLLIIAEAPGQQEDEEGIPMVGAAGKVLRAALRKTGILTQGNTLITNVISCRPPKNKFPKDDCPDICVTKWLWEEIRLAAPQRMLLLGNTPLKYVADLDGITSCRGQWITVRGIRTMATFHPSFIMRKDNEGMISFRETFERDIQDMADEVKKLAEKNESSL